MVIRKFVVLCAVLCCVSGGARGMGELKPKGKLKVLKHLLAEKLRRSDWGISGLKGKEENKYLKEVEAVVSETSEMFSGEIKTAAEVAVILKRYKHITEQELGEKFSVDEVVAGKTEALLHRAARAGEFEVVKMLVTKMNADVNFLYSEKTVLHSIMRQFLGAVIPSYEKYNKPLLKIIRFLIWMGADPYIKEGIFNRNAFQYAKANISPKYEKEVEAALDSLQSVRRQIANDPVGAGGSFIEIVSEFGFNFDQVQEIVFNRLLELQRDVLFKGLGHMDRRGFEGFVDRFKKKYDALVEPFSREPALIGGQPIFRLENLRRKKDYATVLHVAAAENNLDVVEHMINNMGFYINAPDGFGLTALDSMVYEGRVGEEYHEVIEKLINSDIRLDWVILLARDRARLKDENFKNYQEIIRLIEEKSPDLRKKEVAPKPERVGVLDWFKKRYEGLRALMRFASEPEKVDPYLPGLELGVLRPHEEIQKPQYAGAPKGYEEPVAPTAPEFPVEVVGESTERYEPPMAVPEGEVEY